MQPPVAILKRMYVDKSERRGRGLKDGINSIGPHALIRFQQPSHENVQVLRASTDELGERIAIRVALTQEHTLGPETDGNEACIFDQDTLQSNDLIESEAILACLQHGPAPPLQAVSGRPLSLNLETGSAVGEEHKTGRACHQVSAGSPQCFPRLIGKIELNQSFQGFGAPDDPREMGGSQKVVSYAMTFG